ncbi:MAG: hypothetical protein ACRCT8_14615 [Lacipirellulaceae bacterium]
MTPFRIQCETCGTRLRVRDPGFVGEVHACPRCGSMVLIAAPPGEITEDDAERIANHDAGRLASITLAMSATLAAEDSADPYPPDLDAAEPATAEPTPLNEAIAALAAPKGTPWGLVAAASLAAVGGMLAIGLWGGLPRSEPTAAERPRATSTATAPDASAPPVAALPPQETQQPPTAPPPAAAGIDEPEALAPVAAEPQTVDPPHHEPIERSVAAADVAPPEPPPLPVAVVPEPAPSPSNATTSAAPTFRDPLDIDPSTVGLILRRGPSTSIDEAPAAPTAPDAPAERDPAELLAMGLDDRLAAAGDGVGVRVERGPTDDAAKRLPSTPADEAFRAPLREAHLDGAPLWGAVELLAQLAGVPVSIDPAALAAAGTSPDQAVSLSFTGDTVGDALRELLAPVRLDWAADGAYATVVRREGASPARRTVEHRIDDLAQEGPAALAELLAAIGPQGFAPSAREVSEGTWSLEAPRSTHYELLVLFERLRVARGVEPTSRYPRVLLATKPALAELGPTLDRRTTFSFLNPTPVRDVIEHWRRATGLTILVDWRSLADAGLGPAATLSATVTNRPWNEALDGVLGPLGLDWGAIDPRTLWIASRERVAARHAIEFYPLPSADTADALAESLSETLAPGVVVADAASRSVIVLGNAAAQRAAHASWQQTLAAP